MNRCAVHLIWFAIAAVTGLAPAAAAQERPVIGRRGFQAMYVLNFNRGGELVNPAERELAIAELSEFKAGIDRIVIFSYGWANDGESSYATYRNTLEEMVRHIDPSRRTVGRTGETAVIAVGWDSSTSGFRKLFNDLMPLPVLADTLAWLPDRLIFPISFWSKASQADRIGYGGLRTALNSILTEAYPAPERPPEIYLVGHSFGTRIVSGLMRNELAGLDVQAEPFVGADRVKGAVLLQPALVPANLHRDADYPIMVTQSSHDHANGFLYPLANALLNSYSYTTFEAFVDSAFLSPIQSGIESTVGTVSGAVSQLPLPRRDEQEAEDEEDEPPGLARRGLARLRRGTGELLSIPATLVFTLVTLPINYVYTQGRGLLRRPINHVMDTLAQLPVVEVPVWALDRALDREVPWGRLGKGFFSFGSLVEASGRAGTPGPLAREMYPVFTLAELNGETLDRSCLLPVCKGVFAVDATSIVRQGGFGQNLQNPWFDFTIGWLDLIGAHGDYRNPEMMRLMGLMLQRPDSATSD